ncbi:hypothetical protein FHS57_006154 [Runella defluvii]|uniref:Uncharacterized protein n=1 Tax=Runella defluvii TaxID=370973 RepID=A0A7W5ZS54_9BACT|nr:hypothetical protein [Runella defluvii]
MCEGFLKTRASQSIVSRVSQNPSVAINCVEGFSKPKRRQLCRGFLKTQASPIVSRVSQNPSVVINCVEGFSKPERRNQGRVLRNPPHWTRILYIHTIRRNQGRVLRNPPYWTRILYTHHTSQSKSGFEKPSARHETLDTTDTLLIIKINRF